MRINRNKVTINAQPVAPIATPTTTLTNQLSHRNDNLTVPTGTGMTYRLILIQLVVNVRCFGTYIVIANTAEVDINWNYVTQMYSQQRLLLQ